MSNIFYLSKGKIYNLLDGKTSVITSDAVERYLKILLDTKKKNEWKNSNKSALFMGMANMDLFSETDRAEIQSFVFSSDKESLIYAANLGNTCGLYIKNFKDEKEPERFISRKIDTQIYSIDYNENNKNIIASVSEKSIEKHLALFNEESSDFSLLTEGDSVDITPSFSKTNDKNIFYSSAGISFDNDKNFSGYSNYGIYKLEMDKGEVADILVDENYDYLHPIEDSQGNLYCIRSKKASPKDSVSFKDALLVPVKLLKALFSWLNFFTQKYSGDSLAKKTDGANPAKQVKKTEEEIFIEGNLVNVNKVFNDNKNSGEEYPGIIPKSRELICLKANSEIEIIRKGILDYAFDKDNNLIYSNGKCLIRKTSNKEEKLCESDIITNIKLIK